MHDEPQHMGNGNRFDGKVALLTGSAASLEGERMGFGGCTARTMLAEGGKVVITDIQDELGEAAARQMRTQGFDARYMHLDVTNDANWADVVNETVDEFGRLDVLVNIAGLIDHSTLYDVDVEHWRKVVEVSTTGILLGTRAVIKPMTASGGGAIINLSSMAAKYAGEYGSAYAASRAGMLHFTRASAIQLAKFGIRTNTVLPGWVRTPFTEAIYADEAQRSWRAERVPLGRWGEPQEIANGICFLASDDASYITGAELLIDGGVTAGFKGNTPMESE